MEGEILFANKSAAVLYGFSLEELAGQNAGFLFAEQNHFQTMLKKVKEKKKYRFITKKIKKSGSNFYASCNTILIEEQPAEPIILVIERDITDIIEYQRILMRYIQEELLMKEILELFLNSKDYFEAMNFLYERFSHNLRISCIQMFENEKLSYEIGEKTQKVKEIEFFSSLESKKIVFKVFSKENDLEIDIIDNLETILFYIFSNLFNIVEKFKMIQMLQKEKQKAEESERLKTEFLSNMSHEIRTPLNVMSGYLQLLQKTSLGDEQEEYLGMVTKSSQQLLLLINEIIELSKIETGQFIMNQNEFDFFTFIKQINQIYKLKAKDKNLDFIEELDTLPEVICGDQAMIEKVFINILDNSIKFTNQGFIKVKVLSDAQKIYVEITDTGIGIQKDKETLVFKKFVQLDGSPRRKYGGTGVGLTIAKAVIDMMGGEIYYKSLENQGTTFYFSFPIQQTKQ